MVQLHWYKTNAIFYLSHVTFVVCKNGADFVELFPPRLYGQMHLSHMFKFWVMPQSFSWKGLFKRNCHNLLPTKWKTQFFILCYVCYICIPSSWLKSLFSIFFLPGWVLLQFLISPLGASSKTETDPEMIRRGSTPPPMWIGWRSWGPRQIISGHFHMEVCWNLQSSSHNSQTDGDRLAQLQCFYPSRDWLTGPGRNLDSPRFSSGSTWNEDVWIDLVNINVK